MVLSCLMLFWWGDLICVLVMFAGSMDQHGTLLLVDSKELYSCR